MVDISHTIGRHQRECTAFKNYFGSREEAKKLPTDFFLMIHAIRRLERDEAGDVDACTPPTQRTFRSLLSHSEDMQKDVDRLAVFEEVKAKVIRCLGTGFPVAEEMLLHIYGCSQINSFCIRDSFLMITGEGNRRYPKVLIVMNNFII